MIKIVSGGHGFNTTIFDESGRDITSDLRVERIDIKLAADKENMATLTCAGVLVDVESEEVSRSGIITMRTGPQIRLCWYERSPSYLIRALVCNIKDAFPFLFKTVEG